jgi:hypothetical protein
MYIHLCEGTRYNSCLRYYSTSRKVASYVPDDVINLFKFTYSFQPHYGPRVYLAPNRNEHQKIILRGKAQPAHKSDNLTAICEPIF